MVFRHLVLSPLTSARVEAAAGGARAARGARLRTHALRALGVVLSLPRAAHHVICHDLDARHAAVWAEVVHELLPTSPLSGTPSRPLANAEAPLQLRACYAVLRQLDERSSQASDKQVQAVAKVVGVKASLAAKASAFNTDPKAAVERWRADGTLSTSGRSSHAHASTRSGGQVSGEEDCAAPEDQQEADEVESGSRLGSFLFTLPDVSPKVVGDFLSGHARLNKAALRSFMKSFDFTSLTMDSALRLVFAAVRMPGEAQKVDRVMQAFAHAYYRDEPGPFASEKAAYVMAFSIMMLNTDQHNAAVRTKMTVEQFIHNNRKINDGADLPPQFLAALYNEIQQNEIKAVDDTQLVSPASDSGAAPTRWRWRYLQQRRDRAIADHPIDAKSPCIDAMLSNSLAAVAMSAASATLQLAAQEHLQLISFAAHGSVGKSALDESELQSLKPQVWQLAVRTMLRVIVLAAAHGKIAAQLRSSCDELSAWPLSPPAHMIIDQMVTLLCEHSLLPAHVGVAEPSVRAACFNHRSICLGGIAALLARAYPAALGEGSWYYLLRTLLTMQQLHLGMPSLIFSSQDDPLGVKLRGLHPANKRGASAAGDDESVQLPSDLNALAAIVDEAAEAMLGKEDPSVNIQQQCHRVLQLIQPMRALATASQLPDRQLAALLHAAFRTMDDAVVLAIRNPLSATSSAEHAVQMLAELLLQGDTQKRAPWAISAGTERMSRVIATSSCPMPVVHIATDALHRLEACQRRGVE